MRAPTRMFYWVEVCVGIQKRQGSLPCSDPSLCLSLPLSLPTTTSCLQRWFIGLWATCPGMEHEPRLRQPTGTVSDMVQRVFIVSCQPAGDLSEAMTDYWDWGLWSWERFWRDSKVQFMIIQLIQRLRNDFLISQHAALTFVFAMTKFYGS